MRIVTDSSVMLSIEEGARLGMTVLPLTVSVDGSTWLEYEDISSKEFLSLVRAGALPQSASPPPALTLEAYDTDEEVVHLAMADGLSGAYEMTCGLREQARNPERVHVVNTRTLCVPHRALALFAVRLAEQGLDAARIVDELHVMMGSMRSCLMPEDFDYLRRGGRLTPLAAKFAHLVRAFPVMEQTDDGRRLDRLAIARSFKKALAAIAADFEGRGVGAGYFVGVSHADNPGQAADALAWLQERFPACRLGLFELGPAFITQGGPSCIAIQAVDLGACPDLDLRGL
ncbi:DegV family protein [Gordonibacter sp. 28C]|uniref:DegV family protein n=1 Tax=Gordonibacter sp. 28C TaxID=2078569 RepID=UPI000DF773B3|nr:DegV family protein [Gordonibacter sp. 28C]RDB63790.1 DegV family protein [Gordonibacter sp. 28C]